MLTYIGVSCSLTKARRMKTPLRNHFNKHFKESKGLSPREFMKQYEEDTKS